MAAINICSDFGAQNNIISHCPGSHLLAMKWWDGMPWPYISECWALSQNFHCHFHFHQEALYFFTLCHKGGIICISDVIDIYPAILIPACVLFSPAFLMMYAVYKLNKQDEIIQAWHTPFPLWYLSVAPWEKNLNKSGYTYIYIQVTHCSTKTDIYSIVNQLYLSQNK